jgi:cobalamin biosynthesis protein CbiD
MIENTYSEKFESAFEQIKAAANVDAAIRILQAEYGLDFVTYHLAQTIASKIDSPFVRTTYPDAWVSRSSRHRRPMPCWSTPRSTESAAMAIPFPSPTRRSAVRSCR